MMQRTMPNRPAQFDMFGEEQVNDHLPKPAADPRSRRITPAAMDEEDMVAYLAASGRYRVLRKLMPRPVVARPRPASDFPLKGVILDTETTGLNHRKNEIIEIGLIAFTFNAEGEIGDVTGVYGGLRQPAAPLPPEIIKLTGITDEMLVGEAIDMRAVEALIAPADLVIAHNAGFDRPFCEAFSPIFAGKAWACSNVEVGWSARGYEGTKLGYLIGQAGFFHDGHRAVDDCFALLEVLDRKREGEQTTPFSELYAASQRIRVRIFAEHSPFDMKDHLKARGYRWSDGSDGRPKSWWIEVAETDLEPELHYLRSEIYRYPEADPHAGF